MLTRKPSDFTSILDMAAFRGEVTQSIVGAWTGECAQLTHRNGVELVIIVFKVSDLPCTPFGI